MEMPAKTKSLVTYGIDTSLIKPGMSYRLLCEILENIHSKDDVKEISDRATAIKEYALRARNRTLEIQAMEIRIYAERRLGQLLKEGAETKTDKIKLLGGAQTLYNRSISFADIDEKTFQHHMSVWRSKVIYSLRIHDNIFPPRNDRRDYFRRIAEQTPAERLKILGMVLSEMTFRDLKKASKDLNETIDSIKSVIKFLEELQQHYKNAQPNDEVIKLFSNEKISKLITKYKLDHAYSNYICGIFYYDTWKE